MARAYTDPRGLAMVDLGSLLRAGRCHGEGVYVVRWDVALPDPPDSPPEPAADPEEAALRELGRRVVRLRGLIAGICTLLGVAVGIAGYLLLRDWQLQHNGAHVPLFTAGISYGPSLGLSLLIARTLGEVLVRLRADGWIAELAAKHGVAGERLREYSLVWSRSGR